MADNYKRLDQLLAKLSETEATPEELLELEEILLADEEARKRYVHYLDLHNELLSRAESFSETVIAPLNSELQPITSWKKISIFATLAAMALISIGVLIGNRFNQGDLGNPPSTSITEKNSAETDEPMDDGIAMLAHAIDVKWLTENPPLSGTVLSPGILSLETGLLQIEFYSGAKVIAEGPAELELVSRNKAICKQGKIRAFVPQHARGFTVLSPKFELVDLGTEFGMEVGTDGESEVQVFDGEVELYPPDGKRSTDQIQKLLGGSGVSFTSAGETKQINTNQEDYPSFQQVREKNSHAAQRKFLAWKEWNESLADDPRIIARYDFEREDHLHDSVLLDRGSKQADGTIVGSEWTNGRWFNKGALEFKRPSDRVRINVPGEYNEMTLSTWIRVDAVTKRNQSLLLTDNYQVGRVHWQISPEGHLRLGLRLPSEPDKIAASGYGTPLIFTPRRLGIWMNLCTVYDSVNGEVRSYLNGREISKEKIVFEQPISIGSAEIGNWGSPIKRKRAVIRNFVGRMDELTLWNTALSAKEIRDMFRIGRR